MPDVDPFTQVHSKLWDILEDNADFCAMVPADNRIKYVDVGADTARKHPERDSRLPPMSHQVSIEPDGGVVELFKTSDASMINARFVIRGFSNDKRLRYLDGSDTKGAFPLLWAIVNAMADWEAILKPLTVNSKTFDQHCSIAQFSIAQASARDREQNIPETTKTIGWVATVQGETDMWFPNSDLKT
jgi:hypothetical protein